MRTARLQPRLFSLVVRASSSPLHGPGRYVEGVPGQLARIAVDLGTEDIEIANAGRKARWWTPLRKQPDFCAMFAADGLRQIETYLAKWAAYNDYLARRPLGLSSEPSAPE